MQTVTKILFACALSLAATAPALAYEGDWPTESNLPASARSARAQAIAGEHIRVYRAVPGMDARAHEPAEAPASIDYGIGSQR